MPANDQENKDVARELARFDLETANLETTVETLIKVATRAVDALRNEVIGDTTTATKARTLPDALIRKLEQASRAVGAAVKAQNDLLRTAAARGKAMTPEQRVQAFVAAVAKMDYDTRRSLVLEIVDTHNARRQLALDTGVEAPADYRVTHNPKAGKIFKEIL